MTINLLSTQTVMAQTTVEPSKKVYPQKTITPSSPSIPAAGTPSNSSQIKPIKNQTTKKEKGSLEGVPLPKKRGFWAMFFFWSGGVLCMYWVGRRVFREQSHERTTLKRFRDELGHFFPEFDPINIKKWIHIAAEHIYASWRSGDWSQMQSFTSADFIEMQQKASIELSDEGWQRESHLGKVINIHLLGAYMQQGYTVPPLGVELMCRVEVKVIDFKHKVGDTDTVIGVKKPRQEQQIWTLRHTGHTWSLHHVEVADGDITHLKEYDPLPAIIEWKKEDTTTS